MKASKWGDCSLDLLLFEPSDGEMFAGSHEATWREESKESIAHVWSVRQIVLPYFSPVTHVKWLTPTQETEHLKDALQSIIDEPYASKQPPELAQSVLHNAFPF